MDWLLFWHFFLTDKELYSEFYETLDEKIFQDGVMTNTLLLCRKFSEKYKTNPDIDTLKIMLGMLPEEERKRKDMYVAFLYKATSIVSTANKDVMKELVMKEAQKYEMEKFILKTANKIEAVSVEEAMGDLKNIMNKFRANNVGLDLADAKKIIPAIRHQPIDKVSTGMPCLDNVLYGGWGTNELAIVMAPPGKGKSSFLLNVMYNAMMSGNSVLYFTFELSETAVARRLYSRLAYSNRKEMLEMGEDAVEKLATKFFTISQSKGRVIYYPSKSITVDKVESIIDQMQFYHDFTPNILVVDYLDLLAPRASDYKLDVRHRLRSVTDDLRSIALRRGISVVTATQANRESLKKKKITEANVAESFGKIEIADVVMAICQTEEEFKEKRARLAMLKNRDNVSGASLEMFVDFERMLMMDLDIADKLKLLEPQTQNLTTLMP